MERHFYDLGLLAAEGQKKEMEAFIQSRGEELSMATVDADIIHYNVIARFMKEKYLFFVKHFSLKKASEFPVFIRGFSLLLAGNIYASLRMSACSMR